MTDDTRLLDWLEECIVNVIYLDDGRAIDVRGNSVRDAIRAEMKQEAIECARAEREKENR